MTVYEGDAASTKIALQSFMSTLLFACTYKREMDQVDKSTHELVPASILPTAHEYCIEKISIWFKFTVHLRAVHCITLHIWRVWKTRRRDQVSVRVEVLHLLNVKNSLETNTYHLSSSHHYCAKCMSCTLMPHTAQHTELRTRMEQWQELCVNITCSSHEPCYES